MCQAILAGKDSCPAFTVTYQQLYSLLTTCGYSQQDIEAINTICQEQWLLLLENVYYFLEDRFKLNVDETKNQKQKGPAT